LKKFLLSILCALPVVSSFAQKHHEVSLFGGIANYYGDLQPKQIPWGVSDAKTYKPSVGLVYKYFFNPNIGLRFSATYARITGADSLSDIKANNLRNLSFANDIFEMAGGIEINFLPIDMERFKFTPFIYAGIGGFYSNPFALDKDGEKTKLRLLGTEGQGLAQYPDRKLYPIINASFPIGFGFKAMIGNTMMVTLEAGARYTSTDYLDDVSRTYVNLDTLEFYKGKKAVEMAYRGTKHTEWDGHYPNYQFQRGDMRRNDWYWTTGVTVGIYFDSFSYIREYIQTRCPRIFSRR
jgi:hypothetical protein